MAIATCFWLKIGDGISRSINFDSSIFHQQHQYQIWDLIGKSIIAVDSEGFAWLVFAAGLIGRNDIGKTIFLRHLPLRAVYGIPKNCQILHVEQEVVGDDTTSLQCVLDSDVERNKLMQEEAHLLAPQREHELEEANEKSNGALNGDAGKDMVDRLQEIYK